MEFNLYLLFSVLTFTILCTSAYINHRLFKNSENFISILLWCALFTTLAELSVASILEKVKIDILISFVIHIIVWLIWICGMYFDNKLEKKLNKKEGI